MVDTVTAKIEGVENLHRVLEGLGHDLGAKVLRGALMDAAEPIKNDMIDNAPVSSAKTRTVKTRSGKEVKHAPGFLKSRIKKRSRLNRKGKKNKTFGKGEVVRVRVGVFRVPYIVQVEYGASNKGIAPNPFIRCAGERQWKNAVDIFSVRIKRRIDLATRRLAGKSND